MNIKLKPPCWVTHRETGATLRCRNVSAPNRRMKASGWQGLVVHVQNHKGTGIGEYRKFRRATDAEIKELEKGLRKTFGL